MKTTDTNINTTTAPTWCPGCWNFQILAGVKRFFKSEFLQGKTKDDFALVAGIGCEGKMFDYINLNGINTLHGREIPTSLGIKVGNPKREVYAFAGDGGIYNEGVSHLIHAAKENIDMTCIVHNNQVFALTVGQPTGVTETGFNDKTTPEGVKSKPINPLKLILNANASFVARVFAKADEVEQILNEAKKHKGFKFIEVIQPCIIFHKDQGYKEITYNLEEVKHDSNDFDAAMKRASEWNYDGIKESDKIPLGIFYKEKRPTLIDKHWQLQKLLKNAKK